MRGLALAVFAAALAFGSYGFCNVRRGVSNWVVSEDGGHVRRAYEFAVVDRNDFVAGCIQLALMLLLVVLARHGHRRSAPQRDYAP